MDYLSRVYARRRGLGVRHPGKFLKSLRKLSRMVSMDTLTRDILRMLVYVSTHRNTTSFLNMSITGPPGSGKSTVAVVVAKLLGSLGLHDSNPVQDLLNSLESLPPGDGDAAWNALVEASTRTSSGKSYVMTSRVDFVGKYVGHSAIKTKELLSRSKGKVVIIDEAYSLVLDDSRDSFGQEVLAELVKYMSENPKEVFIFLGYEDKVRKNLFETQPGLERRIPWHFRLPGHDGAGLARLFQIQAEDAGVSAEEDFTDLFTSWKKSFPYGGGDTSRLLFQCQLVLSDARFARMPEDEEVDDFIQEAPGPEVITREVLLQGYEGYLEAGMKKAEETEPPPGMYV